MKLITVLAAVVLATTAHATVVMWSFDQVGDQGFCPVIVGDDGFSTVTLAGWTNEVFGPGMVQSPIVGKQDDPIDHGYGVGFERNREIDEADVMIAQFSSNVLGPVTATLESGDGPLGTGEAWKITDSWGQTIASGFGGGIITTAFDLPADHIFVFKVPFNEFPDDYLVSSLSAYTVAQVPNLDALMMLGLGGSLLAGVALLRRRP